MGLSLSEPEHVSSGTFRVDRARLLEKLAAFSLADPADFLIPWVRAAAMSGAKNIRVWTRANGVELRFDGRPFTAAALADPYSSLLDDTVEDGARAREFAIGLLTVLTRGPRGRKGGGPRVELHSGDASGGILFRAESHASESVEVIFDPVPEGTTIKVQLPEKPKVPWTAPAARVAAACVGPKGFSVHVDDKELGSGGPEGGHAMELDGVRAILALASPEDGLSRLSLYAWGAAAGSIEARLPGLPVVGEVDDPRFVLDAARSAVVRDENLERTLGVVSRMGVRIAIGIFDKAREYVASHSWYWASGQDRTAQSLARLRLQCAKRISDAPDGLRELRGALFFIDGRGAPKTLREIELMIRKEGSLRIGNHPLPSRKPVPEGQSPAKEKFYIWLTQRQDSEALKLLFPGTRFVEA